jgi:hypothetical protein
MNRALQCRFDNLAQTGGIAGSVHGESYSDVIMRLAMDD